MHIHINFSTCSNSNWGGATYHCRNILTIERFDVEKRFDGEPETDWTNLIEVYNFFDERLYQINKKIYKNESDKEIKSRSFSHTTKLKPKVEKWLKANIKDRSSSEKGWACGSASSNARNESQFDIFFHRQSDMMSFIQTWSQHKKPLTYFNYFNGTKKELNLKTNRLEKVK